MKNNNFSISEIAKNQGYNNDQVKSILYPKHFEFSILQENIALFKEKILTLITADIVPKETFFIQNITQYLYETLNIPYHGIGIIFLAGSYEEKAMDFFEYHGKSLPTDMDRIEYFVMLANQFRGNYLLEVASYELALQYIANPFSREALQIKYTIGLLYANQESEETDALAEGYFKDCYENISGLKNPGENERFQIALLCNKAAIIERKIDVFFEETYEGNQIETYFEEAFSLLGEADLLLDNATYSAELAQLKAKILYYRGRLFMKEGSELWGLTTLQRSLYEYHDNYVDALFYLVHNFHEQKDWKKSMEHILMINNAIKTFPKKYTLGVHDRFDFNFYQAEAHYHLGNMNSALVLYTLLEENIEKYTSTDELLPRGNHESIVTIFSKRELLSKQKELYEEENNKNLYEFTSTVTSPLKIDRE